MRFALMLTMCVLLSGCAFARGQHEMLDTANLVPPVTVKNAESVRIYRAGTIPEKGCLRVARLAAHGNGNATRATLESKLQDEAQEVGSDAVVILDQEVTQGPSAGTYGGGIAMASTIQFPSLYGVACRKPNFRLGTRWDRDYTVLYVTKGSIADQNGIREGDKILTLNGKLLIDDALVADREFGGKRSGDTVVVEVLREGKKKSISIPLKYTDTARMPVDNNLGSPYGTR